MNRVFKVIWNGSTNSWVAVSELQKSKGKVKSARTVLVNLIAGAGFVFGSADALGAISISSMAGTNAVGLDAVAIGSSMTDEYGRIFRTSASEERAVAIGAGAIAASKSSIALGTVALANHSTNLFDSEDKRYTNSIGVEGGILVPSIAIGMNSIASSANAIALGTMASATGNRATAFGAGSEAAGNRSTVMGWSSVANGTRSFAMGSGAEANADFSGAMGDKSQANGKYSLALGASAISTEAANSSVVIGHSANVSTENGVAIGKEANVSVANSVALGHSSLANKAHQQINDATVGQISYSGFAGKATGVVAVGKKDSERQIVYVAPGKIAADSTDAINGSQLYMAMNGVNNLATSLANHLGGGSTVTTSGAISAPTYKVVNPNKTEPQATANNVGDALTNLNSYINLGFNVKDHAGNTKGTVTPGESIQFINGKNTTVNVATEENGITKISFDVENSSSTASQPTTAPISANSTTGKVGSGTDGSSTAPAADALVKAGDVINAVNGAFWKVAQESKESVKDKVQAGDTVIFANGTGTQVSVENSDGVNTTVKFNVDTGTIAVDENTGDVTVPQNEDNKIASAKTVAEALKKAGFKLTASATEEGEEENTKTEEEVINAGDKIELVAGKNLKIKQEANGKITFASKDNVSFNKVSSNTLEIPTGTNPNDKPITLNSSGLDMAGKPITNVSNGLTTYTTSPKTGLVDLSPTSVADSTAATVGDLRKMGWIVSSDKTTSDDKTPYTNQIKNADQVQFVGTGVAKVSGETKNGVSVITINVDQTEMPTLPSASPISANETTGKIGSGNNGSTDAPAADALVKAGDVINAVNGAFWKVLENGSAEKANINAGDKVSFNNGTYTKAVVSEEASETTNVSFNVDAEKLINEHSPVVYTDQKGNKVVKDGDKYYQANPDGSPNKNAEVKPADIIASMQNISNGSSPTAGSPFTLSNVKSNLPSVNDSSKVITNSDGSTVAANPDNVKKSPLSSEQAGSLAQNSANNAATVSDVLNAGWNLQENGKAVDFVRAADSVNFKNGVNTKIVAQNSDALTSEISVNVVGLPVAYTMPDGTPVAKVGDKFYKVNANGEPDLSNPLSEEETKQLVANLINPNAAPNKMGDTISLGNINSGVNALDGSNRGYSTTTTSPVLIDTSTKLGEALKNAYNGLADLAAAPANNAVTVADLRKLGWVISATGNDYADDVRHANEVRFTGKGLAVVTGKTDETTGVREISVEISADKITDAVKDSGFYVKQNGVSTLAENANEAANEKTEKVTPNDVLDFINGTNSKVTATTTKENGSDTTKIRVDLVGLPVTYTDSNGDKVAKADDGNFYKVDAATGLPKVEGSSKVEPENIVASLVNPNGDNTTTPTTLTNVAAGTNTLDGSVDENGKPLVKVGDAYYTADQLENGKPKANAKASQAVENKVDAYNGLADLAASNPTNAMSVADAKKLGWVISDNNGYADDVRNANEVKFKGEGLASVTGKTNENGVREITIAVKTGEVVKSNEYTADIDGKPETLVKVGENYYKKSDIDPSTGEPKSGVQAVQNPKNLQNNGSGLVSGNQVADAIQKSGFVLGKQSEHLAKSDFKNEDERVNPDDELRFADGKNTIASLATKKSVDHDGNKVTTTTVKVDVDLPIDYKYTDKDGNEVVKSDDGKFYPVDPATGLADTTKPAIDTAANPVKKDGAKLTNGSDDAKPYLENTAEKAKSENKDTMLSGKDGVNLNNVAWAENADQAVNKDQLDQTVAKSGFYVKQNGKSTLKANRDASEDAKTEKVTPNDVVNFVNGKSTTVSAKTTRAANGQDTTEISVDVETTDLTVSTGMERNANNSPAKAGTIVVKSVNGDGGKLVNANTLARAVNEVSWNVESEKDEATANKATKNSYSANGENRVKAGDTVKVNAGRNVEISGSGKTLNIAVSENPVFADVTATNTVTVGQGNTATTISSNADGLSIAKPDGSAQRITNVSAGRAETDAVNVGQLNQVKGAVNKLDKRMRGIGASSAAASSLPQVYIPGKSMIAASAGGYSGATAIAVGYSRASDNGKLILKIQGSADSNGHLSGGVGAGYQW